MIETYLGKTIKKNREAQGLSQEKLCGGICSVPTLSRIENKGTIPSRDCATALLQRLGLSADRYYMMISKYDADIDRLESEINSCYLQYDRTQGEERERARIQGVHKLQELKVIVEEDDRIGQQFLLKTEAILGETNRTYDVSEQLTMLMDAVHLTIPKFDLDKINNFLYSLEELKILTQVAVRQAKTGNLKKSIKTLEQLFDYVQEHNRNMSQSAGQLPLIAYNYAIKLGQAKRYSDAIEIAEVGRQSCIDCGNYHLLPGFMHIQAECYYFLGDDADSKTLYTKAYYFYQSIENKRDLELLKEEASRYLNLEFTD